MTETKPAPVKQAPARRPQLLSGFRDQLPAQQLLRRKIIETFCRIFERHGFDPIDTPAIEHYEVLTGKAGENEKLMYQFDDAGGRRVGLRFDLTVPLARFVALHESEIVFPFKRYHIGPVWRAEKAQRGRLREFWQCDADIVGSAGVLADAEAIAIAAEALTAVHLPNYRILVSHRQLLEALARSCGVDPAHSANVFRAVDKLAKIGPAGVRQELIDSGVGTDAASALLEVVTSDADQAATLSMLRDRLSGQPDAEGALADIAHLFELLPVFGIPERRLKLDTSLARGLDYYTGIVFEAVVDEPNVGSLVGAGRYDGLVGVFLGRSVPATGMSLGLERIIEVVREFNLIPAEPTTAEAVVVVFPELIAGAVGVARTLREGGLNVDLSLQPHKSIGEQLKHAARRSVPLAVIAGEQELERSVVAVKDLRSGRQWEVSLSAAAVELRKVLTDADTTRTTAGLQDRIREDRSETDA